MGPYNNKALAGIIINLITCVLMLISINIAQATGIYPQTRWIQVVGGGGLYLIYAFGLTYLTDLFFNVFSETKARQN